VPELTIAAVEVEAVRRPTGRFPYPVQWQAQPLDVYLAPGEAADAPAELTRVPSGPGRMLTGRHHLPPYSHRTGLRDRHDVATYRLGTGTM
jgi:hypothetical protein